MIANLVITIFVLFTLIIVYKEYIYKGGEKGWEESEVEKGEVGMKEMNANAAKVENKYGSVSVLAKEE